MLNPVPTKLFERPEDDPYPPLWHVRAHHPNGLGYFKNCALDALLESGGRVAEAARRAGCDRTTMRRYLKDPAFLSQLRARVAGLNELLQRLEARNQQ